MVDRASVVSEIADDPVSEKTYTNRKLTIVSYRDNSSRQITHPGHIHSLLVDMKSEGEFP